MNSRIAHKISTREALLLPCGYSGPQFTRALGIVCRRPRSYADFDYAHAVLYGMPPPYADDPEPAHGVRRRLSANPAQYSNTEIRKRRSLWPDGTPRKPEAEIPF